jgi:dihydroorotate dehydrogenase (fumarate)
MPELKTTYLGLNLRNPLVASASPYSKKVEKAKELADAGIGAIVMHSLFEEQINHESRALDHFLNQGTESFAEALTYFPEMDHYDVGPEKYLKLIGELKKSLPIPVIASLNGVSSGGWVDYSRRMQDAGADALELNIYFLSTDAVVTSGDLEKAQVELVQQVSESVRIPVSVKLNPFYTSLPNFAARLTAAGAKGLVFFNRFYQPDLDIDALEVVPTLELSTSAEMRLPLRWIAILYGKLQADLALSSGVHTGADAVKALMAGSQVAMMTSALVHEGAGHAAKVLEEMTGWMKAREYTSVDQMRGALSQKGVANPAAFERANYLQVLTRFDTRLK